MAQNQYEQENKKGNQPGNKGQSPQRDSDRTYSDGKQDKHSGQQMNQPRDREGRDSGSEKQQGQRGYTDPANEKGIY